MILVAIASRNLTQNALRLLLLSQRTRGIFFGKWNYFCGKLYEN